MAGDIEFATHALDGAGSMLGGIFGQAANVAQQAKSAACAADLKSGKHCTQCGVKLQPDARFCADCGTKVD